MELRSLKPTDDLHKKSIWINTKKGCITDSIKKFIKDNYIDSEGIFGDCMPIYSDTTAFDDSCCLGLVDTEEAFVLMTGVADTEEMLQYFLCRFVYSESEADYGHVIIYPDGYASHGIDVTTDEDNWIEITLYKQCTTGEGKTDITYYDSDWEVQSSLTLKRFDELNSIIAVEDDRFKSFSSRQKKFITNQLPE